MDPVEKSICRKLRRLFKQQSGWSSERDVTASFTIGQFAAQLLPFWMESDYPDFQDYLVNRCGSGLRFVDTGKITLWALTYYEIPSLAIWLEVGWRQAAAAASRNQEGQRENLLDYGLNVLDLLTLV